jgi:hypothetical protein
MGFTTSCFIRKNTPELRKKLEELGYKECIGEEGPFLFTSHNIFDCMYTECGLNDLAYNGLIDCGTNEDLFLAIAALRDDTDNNQMFINGKGDWGIYRDNTKYGGLSGIDFYGMPNDLNVDNYHKATVEELIEHFKGKEEI